MPEDLLTLPRRVLENSYDVYNDLNRMNSAISRAAGVLGAEKIELPSILENKEEPSETAQVQQAPQQQIQAVKGKPDTHTRAISLRKAFGFSSKVLESAQKPEAHKILKEKHAARPAPVGAPLTAVTPPAMEHRPVTIPGAAKVPELQRPPLKIVEPPTIKTEHKEYTPQIQRTESVKAIERKISSLPPTTVVPKPIQIPKVQTIQKTEPVIKTAVTSESTENNEAIVRKMEGYSLENAPAQQALPAEEKRKEVIASNNPVSNLLALVKTKHSVSIGEAAAALKVDRSLVETWAKLLNSSALLKIRYQLIGDTILEA